MLQNVEKSLTNCTKVFRIPDLMTYIASFLMIKLNIFTQANNWKVIQDLTLVCKQCNFALKSNKQFLCDNLIAFITTEQDVNLCKGFNFEFEYYVIRDTQYTFAFSHIAKQVCFDMNLYSNFNDHILTIFKSTSVQSLVGVQITQPYVLIRCKENFPNLTHIELKFISNNFVLHFEGFENLKNIFLDGCGTADILICNNLQLQTLNVANCSTVKIFNNQNLQKITLFKIDKLKMEDQYLQNVHSVKLTKCHECDFLLKCKNLEKLTIDCDLVCPWFGNLKNLKKLSLIFKEVTCYSMQTLCTNLPCLEMLQINIFSRSVVQNILFQTNLNTQKLHTFKCDLRYPQTLPTRSILWMKKKLEQYASKLPMLKTVVFCNCRQNQVIQLKTMNFIIQ